MSANDPKRTFSDETISVKPLNWAYTGIGHNAKQLPL